ncbi:DUF397 domain-containing protein [Streptomyces sp. NPDC058619]|uniref:DUF397 domain-containing protein n=1 Tax=unclassified Streptomyces TaxID=2593676 RepID=UPI0036507EE6
MTEEWQRSTHCAEGNSCVYVAIAPDSPGHVLVAGSPGSPRGGPPARVVRVGAAAWGALLDAVRSRQL